jgi:hypothetical protein
MARVGLFAICTALGVLVAAPGRAGEPDQAETLFRAGNRAFAAGDYTAAYEQYREAWSLRKSFDIACNLGRTEAELGFSRDAAEHLDQCLRTYSVSSRSEVKDANRRFRELFERERAKVGTLEVESNPPGAEIAVDGMVQGTSPLGRSLFLEPGEHRIRARLSGYRDRVVVVDATAGESESLRLELVSAVSAPPPVVVVGAAARAKPGEPPPVEPAAAAPEQGAAESTGGMEPRTIVALSGAALTLVGLGIGVGFMLDANAKGERASELHDSLTAAGATCTDADNSRDCQELKWSLNQQDESRDIASVAFLGSAIASAVTACLWLALPEFKSSQATGWRVAPRVSKADGFGLSVSRAY